MNHLAEDKRALNGADELLTPKQRYAAAIADSGFAADAAQARAVAALDLLYRRLVQPAPVAWWRRALRPATPPPKGLYLWGRVGRGKTWLMDGFYECLPFAEKRRLHFHHFMRMVHARLKELPDQEDPLKRVAKDFSADVRVLCFDEFFVADIGDAMLLGRLLQCLFADGVTLVATSNMAPDDLYKDGLQRERFLPAIRAIKQHAQVLNVDGAHDYRLRHLEKTRLYYVPAGETADAHLAEFFVRISGGARPSTEPLSINGREIRVKKHADGAAWFDFAAICAGPRSQMDYIEIAHTYHTVLISGIPVLNADLENEARRFVALVDEFYDRR
ncbi:MAG: cell division protein ZapE, partial [Rhodanobacteraceae bacterium]